MKRLLVLSYYFPPMGMSGVQRTLKFVKYLPEFGWQPMVLTIKPCGSYGYDPALLDEIPNTEIIRTPSLDPLYLSPSRQRPIAAARRGIVAVLNRFFVPDNKLGWIPFALSRGLSFAKKNNVDAIYSTAPPFSSHLAALALKNILRKPLICDFRDAWTNNPQASYASPLHKYLDLYLEKKVLRSSDRVVAINQEIVDSFIAKHPEIGPEKFTILPQGFDPADFEGVKPLKSPKFNIVYTGTFVGKRTPQPLLTALSTIRRSHPQIFNDIQVIFAGTHRKQDIDIVRQARLDQTVEFKGYLPHRESIALLIGADLLWLVIDPCEGNTVATSKLYEYLGAKKPILANVPEDGAAAKLIKETSSGTIIPNTEPDSMAVKIVEYYDLYKKNKNNSLPTGIDIYNRRNIAGLLSDELNRLTDT